MRIKNMTKFLKNSKIVKVFNKRSDKEYMEISRKQNEIAVNKALRNGIKPVSIDELLKMVSQ